MDNLSLNSKPVEGLGSAARLRRLRRLAPLGLGLLALYWAGCLAVIILGLDRASPQLGAAAGEPAPADEPGPAGEPAPARWAHGRTRPYYNCAEAHAAGVYDIPSGSALYTPRQDGDGDGLACEPVR